MMTLYVGYLTGTYGSSCQRDMVAFYRTVNSQHRRHVRSLLLEKISFLHPPLTNFTVSIYTRSNSTS